MNLLVVVLPKGCKALQFVYKRSSRVNVKLAFPSCRECYPIRSGIWKTEREVMWFCIRSKGNAF